MLILWDSRNEEDTEQVQLSSSLLSLKQFHNSTMGQWGCCNKGSPTGWLKQEKFLRFWRLGSPGSRCQLIRFLDGILFLAISCFLTVSSHIEKKALSCLLNGHKSHCKGPMSIYHHIAACDLNMDWGDKGGTIWFITQIR